MTDARILYRESAVGGASPVRLVAMLYEQMVEDLRRAERAIDENHIEARTNAINHALVILGHLEGKLNIEAGGKVAHNLARFYNVLRRKLTEAQFQVSKQILNEQISLLLDLRDAWTQVDRAEDAQAPESSKSSAAIEQKARADWKA